MNHQYCPKENLQSLIDNLVKNAIVLPQETNASYLNIIGTHNLAVFIFDMIKSHSGFFGMEKKKISRMLKNTPYKYVKMVQIEDMLGYLIDQSKIYSTKIDDNFKVL